MTTGATVILQDENLETSSLSTVSWSNDFVNKHRMLILKGNMQPHGKQ